VSRTCAPHDAIDTLLPIAAQVLPSLNLGLKTCAREGLWLTELNMETEDIEMERK